MLGLGVRVRSKGLCLRFYASSSFGKSFKSLHQDMEFVLPVFKVPVSLAALIRKRDKFEKTLFLRWQSGKASLSSVSCSSKSLQISSSS